MTARSSIPALLVALLLSLTFVTAACGSDGEVTDADYLIELLGLDSEFSRIGEILAEGYSERLDAAVSEQERAVEIREFSAESMDRFEEVLDGTKDLSPTEDFEEAYETRITALEAALVAWQEVDDQLDDIDTEAEMKALLEQLFTSEVFEDIGAPCFAERAIDIDIGCDAAAPTPGATEPSDATPRSDPRTPAP